MHCVVRFSDDTAWSIAHASVVFQTASKGASDGKAGEGSLQVYSRRVSIGVKSNQNYDDTTPQERKRGGDGGNDSKDTPKDIRHLLIVP